MPIIILLLLAIVLCLAIVLIAAIGLLILLLAIGFAISGAIYLVIMGGQYFWNWLHE
jgi:hypothetical protein